MADIWIPFFAAGLLLVLIISILVLLQRHRDRSIRICESRIGPYTDLMNAITGLYLAGTDDELISLARLDLARQINRVNIIAGAEVIRELNAYLDLVTKSGRTMRRIPEEHERLQRLMEAIRRETRHNRILSEKSPSFKFYMPASGETGEGRKAGDSEI